jgi:hypothetical protein
MLTMMSMGEEAGESIDPDLVVPTNGASSQGLPSTTSMLRDLIFVRKGDLANLMAVGHKQGVHKGLPRFDPSCRGKDLLLLV